MITFTPLSGGAQLSKTIPLCYLLQVDDVRILLDCGSPDWCPESDNAYKPGEALPKVDKNLDLVGASNPALKKAARLMGP